VINKASQRQSFALVKLCAEEGGQTVTIANKPTANNAVKDTKPYIGDISHCRGGETDNDDDNSASVSLHCKQRGKGDCVHTADTSD
jgi:hypothetical protein